MSINIERIENEKIDISFFRFGENGKSPIVIIPGLSVMPVVTSAQAIIAQYKMFTKDFDIYLIDRNMKSPNGYTMFDMAKDTAFVLKEIGIENANLFGVSQGGMIAQELAIYYPELVKSLTLCSTCLSINPSDAEVVREWIALAENKKAEDLLDSFMSNVYTEDFYKKHKSAIKVFAKFIKDKDMKRFVKLALPLFDFNIKEDLKKVNVPAFVCASKLDKVIPFKCEKELVETLHAREYVYENYSHALYDEAPDYLDKVYDFLMSIN